MGSDLTFDTIEGRIDRREQFYKVYFPFSFEVSLVRLDPIALITLSLVFRTEPDGFLN